MDGWILVKIELKYHAMLTCEAPIVFLPGNGIPYLYCTVSECLRDNPRALSRSDWSLFLIGAARLIRQAPCLIVSLDEGCRWHTAGFPHCRDYGLLFILCNNGLLLARCNNELFSSAEMGLVIPLVGWVHYECPLIQLHGNDGDSL